MFVLRCCAYLLPRTEHVSTGSGCMGVQYFNNLQDLMSHAYSGKGALEHSWPNSMRAQIIFAQIVLLHCVAVVILCCQLVSFTPLYALTSCPQAYMHTTGNACCCRNSVAGDALHRMNQWQHWTCHIWYSSNPDTENTTHRPTSFAKYGCLKGS